MKIQERKRKLKNYVAFLFVFLIIGFSVGTPWFVSATSSTGDTTPAASTELYNPLGSGVTLASFIGRGIRAVIGVIGAVALLMFIYGGIIWMTSGGSDERVTMAKNILKNATIGLLLIFFSYSIISIFFSIFAP